MLDTTNYEFLTAHFSNNERTVVTVYWGNKDETIEEIVKAEDKDPAWQRLLDHMDIDTLHETTYKHIREQAEAYENEVIAIAQRNGLWADIFAKEEDAFVEVCKLMLRPDEDIDKELLFKVKIKLFDTEEVANCDDREIKSRIRKATNFYSLLLEYGKLRK